jgi:Uma2 family endonuclease
MTPREFDRADFVAGWRYELIRGLLIVCPTPAENERQPTDELNYLLRVYRDSSPHGSVFRSSLHEQPIKAGDHRRVADCAIWAGLGRHPRRSDRPTIIVDFVSAGKRDRVRDFEVKRDEYLALDVKEYWIIDRFKRNMTVHIGDGDTFKKRVVRANQKYKTDLLPGFELPLAPLLAAADRWDEPEPEPS